MKGESGVRFKFKRIASGLLAIGIASGVVYRGSAMRDWLECSISGSRPSENDGRITPNLEEELWSPRNHSSREIRWQNGGGWVPGRVEMEKWETSDRIFYRVRGPISPSGSGDATHGENHSQNPEDMQGVFCEVLFKTDFGCEIRKFSAAAAMSLWMSEGRIVAAAAVPGFSYHIVQYDGYMTLTFWTTTDEPVGNIVFRYHEAEQEGWLSTDRSGTTRLDVQQWTWP
ncbi:MAG: hypothetical protein IT541_09615 [Hyphomicrobiales bacterium]|nr:hypothetical protein [Hyphomicrobiales bacterium]